MYGAIVRRHRSRSWACLLRSRPPVGRVRQCHPRTAPLARWRMLPFLLTAILLPIPFRRFAAEFTCSRHAVMERDRIKVKSVGPGKCTKFHEDAGEECRIFEWAHHLSVAHRGR